MAERRRAMGLGHAQGVLWAIGNGLTTGPLVIYLVLEMHGRSRDIGLILAAPAFVGLLRVLAPALLRTAGGLKPGALAYLGASYVLICFLPFAASLAMSSAMPARWGLRMFVALLCIHQLLESIGLVAVWSWLGQIVPTRIRGRYFARRQRWQLAALVPTLLVGGLAADTAFRKLAYSTANPSVLVWAYAGPIGIGALFLVASIFPLWRMPAVEAESAAPAAPATPLARKAFFSGPFVRLVLVGCWLSLFNGLTQAAQNIYPRGVLGLEVLPLAIMRIVMQFGQIALAPVVGRSADRYGNRPVLVISQVVVAFGLLFYLLATKDQPYWLAGAWILWSAFVGLNVCLPNLMLKLAPGRNSAAYVATYFALTGVAYAVGTVTGGELLDLFRLEYYRVLGIELNYYGYLFYIGWVTRLLGAVLLLSLIEPGAWGVLEMIRGRRTVRASENRGPQSPWDERSPAEGK